MKDANAILSQVISITKLIVGFVILLILAGTTARAARIGIPWLPALSPTEMCYLAGAWYLTR